MLYLAGADSAGAGPERAGLAQLCAAVGGVPVHRCIALPDPPQRIHRVHNSHRLPHVL